MMNAVYFAPMNRSQYIAIAAALVLVIACYMPWVQINNPQIVLTGMNTGATRHGKPGLNHFILTFLVLVCTFVPRLWAKRFNLLFAALNFAWAIRNFTVITRCEGGECPVKQWGIYLTIITTFILLVTAFFPNIEIESTPQNKPAT